MSILREPLDQIDQESLNKLQGDPIPEGMQIDYKGGFPDNKNLAKVVAAFANTRGGLILVGVHQDGDSKALTINGIDANPANTEKVDQLIFENIHPTPSYSTKELVLSSGKSVVLIRVEESEYPPHFVQGRIPVRCGETSNWITELKHYHEIEKLYERRQANGYDGERLHFCQLYSKDVYKDSLGAGNFPFWMLSTAAFPTRGRLNYPIFSSDLKEHLANGGDGEFRYSSSPTPSVQFETAETQFPVNLAHFDGQNYVLGRKRTRIYERFALIHIVEGHRASPRGTDSPGGFKEYTLDMQQVLDVFGAHLEAVAKLIRRMGYRSEIALATELSIPPHTADMKTEQGLSSTPVQQPKGPVLWDGQMNTGPDFPAKIGELTVQFGVRMRRLLGEYVLDADM